MNTIFLEGGCYAVFGCSRHDDEWLEEKHSEILKTFADNISEPHSVMTSTKRLPGGDIKLSYRITYSSLHGTNAEVEEYIMSVLVPKYQEWLENIIPCDDKDNLYIRRKNPETKRMETRTPNYPHLVISKNPVQQVNLKYEFEYSDIPKRRWSLS